MDSGVQQVAMGQSSTELAEVLTPTLYNRVLQNRMPWAKEQKLDFEHVAQYIFRGAPGQPQIADEFYQICFPALKALSIIPIRSMPNLLEYLPSVTSPLFPIQALSLQILLDQGPRSCLEGADVRWKYDFFDKVSQQYAHSLLALPEPLQPLSKSRWTGIGATFDYWVLTTMWFQAPFVHSEDISAHDIAQSINENVRLEVEARAPQRDPHRSDPNYAELLNDTLAYPRILSAGPPTHPGYRLHEFAYWELTLMDVHRCIILKYGGYPQRKSARGQELSERDIEYLEKTGHFDEISRDEAEKVKQDVKKGVWSPLKGRE
jgi:uncharacterized protein (DUF924 family)